MSANNICTFCQSALIIPKAGRDNSVGAATCGHVFHLLCFDNWKATRDSQGIATRCPLCNKPAPCLLKLFLGSGNPRSGTQAVHHAPTPPSQIIIRGAGTQDVNGTYCHDDYNEGACTYVMDADWCRFTIFKCITREGRMRWFLAIVGQNKSPGTTDDIDFYTSEDFDCHFPPLYNWKCCYKMAVDPPLTLEYLYWERRCVTSAASRPNKTLSNLRTEMKK